MATTSFNVQSIFLGGLATRKINTNKLFSAKFSILKRNYPMVVRSMAEPTKDESAPSPPPPSKPKVSTKFSDLLAFSGPAPERINGRLAMVGFVSALAVELSKGENIFAQVSDGGVSWFLVTTSILTLASLVPLYKGITAESKSDGFMTSNAELWNGRFAMLGLVALAFTEFVKGGTLV